MASIGHNLKITVDTYAKITDYKYSPSGNLLAVSNSEGKIIIHKRTDKNFKKVAEFTGDDASIWSISWANPKYGNILAIASFKKKVAIFQQINQVWKQVAFHQLHQASVNNVEWSPCGLKLFACGTDGKISILELVGKAWKTSFFTVSDSAITTFTLQPLPLSQIISEQQEDSFYPRIVTISKDQNLRIFGHKNEVNYSDKSDVYEQKNQQINKCGYLMLKNHHLSKQTIRSLLWKPMWGTMNESFLQLRIIYCSEEGNVKVLVFSQNPKENNEYNCQFQYPILEGEVPIVRISQSITGNSISISLAEKQVSRTILYAQEDSDKWIYAGEGSL